MTDNPIYDFLVHDAKQREKLERLPVCSECGNHIQDDMAYYINDIWMCENCMDGYKRPVPDL